jgi:hypothetical protein
MNQNDGEDKLDPQDPHRREIQPPIPTHPPDPLAKGDADKVVGPAEPGDDPKVSTGISSGAPRDQAGGPGLGEPPAAGGAQSPATIRDRDTRAEDQQDRTGKT